MAETTIKNPMSALGSKMTLLETHNASVTVSAGSYREQTVLYNKTYARAYAVFQLSTSGNQWYYATTYIAGETNSSCRVCIHNLDNVERNFSGILLVFGNE